MPTDESLRAFLWPLARLRERVPLLRRLEVRMCSEKTSVSVECRAQLMAEHPGLLFIS